MGQSMDTLNRLNMCAEVDTEALCVAGSARRDNEWSKCAYEIVRKRRGGERRAVWKCTVCNIGTKVKKDTNEKKVRKEWQ